MGESPTKLEQEWEKTSGSLTSPDVLEGPVNVDDDQPMPVSSSVRRKIDLHLIPLVAILYLCSFL
jgi:hypothetical protein